MCTVFQGELKFHETVVDLDVTNPENYKLYGVLQNQLRTEMKASLIKSIQVQ